MINTSLKNPIVESNLTLLEMMAELDRLKQENEQLKAERDEWKEGFKLLHNMMEDENESKELNGYDKTLFERNSSEQDDDYNEDELVNAYVEAEKDFKFAGADFSIN